MERLEILVINIRSSPGGKKKTPTTRETDGK
jgi:hypothetical protein